MYGIYAEGDVFKRSALRLELKVDIRACENLRVSICTKEMVQRKQRCIPVVYLRCILDL